MRSRVVLVCLNEGLVWISLRVWLTVRTCSVLALLELIRLIRSELKIFFLFRELTEIVIDF